MDQEISIYNYVVSMLSVMVLMGLVAGVYAKFVSMMVGVLAYPTYLALYGMEFILAPGVKTDRKLFGFNIPKKGNKRYASHWLAAFVTSLLLVPLGIIFLNSLSSQEAQLNFIVGAMYGRLLPVELLLLPLGCLFGLYGISWFSELDEKTPMEKIEHLSVPSLWKKVVKI